MADTTTSGALHPMSKADDWAIAINTFACTLHRLLAKEKGNVFFSPYSVSTAMAMLYWAAEGKTGEEMKLALGFAGLSKDDVITGFEQVLSSKINSSCTLSSANALVMTSKNFDVKDSYRSILKESFKAFFLQVDVQRDSEQAVKDINEWVKSKTNDKISELLKVLRPNAVMVLLNAVYFKGSWLQKFDKADTSSKKFYNKGVKNQAKSIKMMHMKEKFRLAEQETFQALQLPYAGEDIAMLILLPRRMDGLEELEASILSPTFIQDLTRRMFKVKVTVDLPRFRLEYSKDLIPSFKQLGVDKLFDAAELGGLSDSKGLYVSDIVHRAVLEVNEEGSEAAAATAVVVAYRCAPRNREFVVDHPFAFVIYNVKSNLILFMGRVEEL